MKKIIVLLISLFGFISAYAQNPIQDITSGKHIKNTLTGNVDGQWTCRDCQNQFQINLKTSSAHIKRGKVDVTFDYLIIDIIKFIVKGEDISSHYKGSIKLHVTADDHKEFYGRYRDPITKNNIIAIMKQVDKDTFLLKITFPEMDVENDLSKGTLFPKTATFTR